MGQLGFFDIEKRLVALSEKGDPLEGPRNCNQRQIRGFLKIHPSNDDARQIQRISVSIGTRLALWRGA
jgi:hypothetical protein